MVRIFPRAPREAPRKPQKIDLIDAAMSSKTHEYPRPNLSIAILGTPGASSQRIRLGLGLTHVPAPSRGRKDQRQTLPYRACQTLTRFRLGVRRARYVILHYGASHATCRRRVPLYTTDESRRCQSSSTLRCPRV